jgi:hypothetical protein
VNGLWNTWTNPFMTLCKLGFIINECSIKWELSKSVYWKSLLSNFNKLSTRKFTILCLLSSILNQRSWKWEWRKNLKHVVSNFSDICGKFGGKHGNIHGSFYLNCASIWMNMTEVGISLKLVTVSNMDFKKYVKNIRQWYSVTEG